LSDIRQATPTSSNLEVVKDYLNYLETSQSSRGHILRSEQTGSAVAGKKGIPRLNLTKMAKSGT